MAEKFNIEDEYAKTALETAVEVMKTPTAKMRACRRCKVGPRLHPK